LKIYKKITAKSRNVEELCGKENFVQLSEKNLVSLVVKKKTSKKAFFHQKSLSLKIS